VTRDRAGLETRASVPVSECLPPRLPDSDVLSASEEPAATAAIAAAATRKVRVSGDGMHDGDRLDSDVPNLPSQPMTPSWTARPH
jgi:hypothetical protein